MYVKPTDLGPLYKEPVLAEAYIATVDSPAEYLSYDNRFDRDASDDFDWGSFISVAWNVYVYDRL